jgi:hypothetical protein
MAGRGRPPVRRPDRGRTRRRRQRPGPRPGRRPARQNARRPGRERDPRCRRAAAADRWGRALGPGLAPRQEGGRDRRPGRGVRRAPRGGRGARLRAGGTGRGARSRLPRRERGEPRRGLRPVPPEPGRLGDRGGLRPAGRGAGRVLHPAGGAPAGADLRRRAGAGDGHRRAAHQLGARAAVPPGHDRVRRLDGDVAVRRDARHPRLHDRPLGAGRAAYRGVLGEGVDVPELPLPLRGRGTAAGLVRRQGHVRRADLGAWRRAEHRGLLQRPDHRQARRAGQALGIVLFDQDPRGVGQAAARGRGRLRAGTRPGGDPRRPAPGRNRAGRPPLRRAARRCRGRLDDLGTPDLSRPTGSRPACRRPTGEVRGARREAATRSGWSWASRRTASGGLLRVRRRAARGRGARRPRRGRDQGRAPRRRGDAGGRVRRRGLPAGQAQPRPRHQRAAGPARRRTAAEPGGRGAAQFPGRGRRAARHRCRDGRPAESAGRLLSRERVRRHGTARPVPGERRADGGGHRDRAGDRRGRQRPDRGDLDSDRHHRRLAGRGRHTGGPVRAGQRPRGPAGGDEPPGRGDPAAQRGVLPRRRAGEWPVARRGADRLRPGVPDLPRERRRLVRPGGAVPRGLAAAAGRARGRVAAAGLCAAAGRGRRRRRARGGGGARGSVRDRPRRRVGGQAAGSRAAGGAHRSARP